MSDVTQLLNAIDAGDPQAAEQLLPLVYDELRKLAAAKMAQEKPGQTLQATALVHEAWLRLTGVDEQKVWNSRGHFFGAAASAKTKDQRPPRVRRRRVPAGKSCVPAGTCAFAGLPAAGSDGARRSGQTAPPGKNLHFAEGFGSETAHWVMETRNRELRNESQQHCIQRVRL